MEESEYAGSKVPTKNVLLFSIGGFFVVEYACLLAAVFLNYTEFVPDNAYGYLSDITDLLLFIFPNQLLLLFESIGIPTYATFSFIAIITALFAAVAIKYLDGKRRMIVIMLFLLYFVLSIALTYLVIDVVFNRP